MFLQLSARLRDKLTPPLPATTIRESAMNFQPVSIVESVFEPIVPSQKTAFHQLHLFDWTACDEPLKWIEQLLTELKEKTKEEDSQQWQVEWESKNSLACT